MDALLVGLVGFFLGGVAGYAAGYIDRTDPIQRIRREQWRK